MHYEGNNGVHIAMPGIRILSFINSDRSMIVFIIEKEVVSCGSKERCFTSYRNQLKSWESLIITSNINIGF